MLGGWRDVGRRICYRPGERAIAPGHGLRSPVALSAALGPGSLAARPPLASVRGSRVCSAAGVPLETPEDRVAVKKSGSPKPGMGRLAAAGR
jgi:hypothetical protein